MFKSAKLVTVFFVVLICMIFTSSTVHAWPWETVKKPVSAATAKSDKTVSNVPAGSSARADRIAAEGQTPQTDTQTQVNAPTMPKIRIPKVIVTYDEPGEAPAKSAGVKEATPPPSPEELRRAANMEIELVTGKVTAINKKDNEVEVVVKTKDGKERRFDSPLYMTAIKSVPVEKLDPGEDVTINCMTDKENNKSKIFTIRLGEEPADFMPIPAPPSTSPSIPQSKEEAKK